MKRLIAIALLAIVGYAALPYWSAYSLAQGLKVGDRAVLERQVDWDRVRAGLKDDISQVLVEGNQDNGARAFLAAALGPQLVDAALDSLVTPANVASLAQGAADRKAKREETAAAKDVARDPVAHLTWAFFTSPSQFLVTLETDQVKDGTADLYFERQGLSWPLVRVKLPDSALSGLTS